jgi:heat shock protein HtpX
VIARPSMFSRAVMAVVLMIGFYLLALGIAFGLFYLPYAEMTYAHRLHIKLALFCGLGGLAILWSILPRFDKFEAPGPLLTKEQHPKLFAELESVAAAVQQSMPVEVYLVSDVNAWVTQRGGVMGFGSRRVMGMGLPLMRLLTKSQFKAVLAHEFGHYHSGDTQLGPWIYKTRGALARTVHTLSGDDGEGSLLQIPFNLYSKMFLRITHAISRQQEFVADELAARTVSAKALSDGLRTVHGVAPAYQAYWANECAPVLNAGYRPPLVEGFQKFVSLKSIAESINQHIEEALKEGKADPYDTHPPLKDRIAAVQGIVGGEVFTEDPPAITLLGDVAALEHELLVELAGPENAAKLKTISWDKVCEEVYLPQWRKLVQANEAVLQTVQTEDLPAKVTELAAFGRQLCYLSGEKVSRDEAEPYAGAVLGAAVAVLLVDLGGKVNSDPGGAIEVTWNGQMVEPFSVVERLKDNKLSAEDWNRMIQGLGIAGMKLSASAS